MPGAELTAHPGHEDGKDAPPGQPNRRNGTAGKRLKGRNGGAPISVRRARAITFQLAGVAVSGRLFHRILTAHHRLPYDGGSIKN